MHIIRPLCSVLVLAGLVPYAGCNNSSDARISPGGQGGGIPIIQDSGIPIGQDSEIPIEPDSGYSDGGNDAGDADVNDSGPTELVCPDSLNCTQPYCDQILIPGGERTMGSYEAPQDVPGEYFGTGDERPPHLVNLDTFCIDTYEVTYERYAACVVAGVCDPNGHTWNGGRFIQGHPVVINHFPPECEGDYGDVSLCWQHPVNCRNNETSAKYCEWVGRKLCTEAQWERAANGPGPIRKYPWGDDEPQVWTANLPPWSNQITAEVNAFPDDVSPEGVRGLGGNVVEWVSNYYGPYQPDPGGGAIANPQGPSTGEWRSARGGCYFDGIYTNIHRHTFDPEFNWG